MLGRILLEFAGAVVAAEGDRVGLLRVNRTAAERALVVDCLAGDLHLLDEVVGILLELALAVVAAETNEVTFVAAGGLDGVAAERALVVDRGGLDLGDGGSRILGELALAVATAEPDRVGGFLLYGVTAERALGIDRAGDGADHDDQTQATQQGSEPFDCFGFHDISGVKKPIRWRSAAH